MECERTVIPRFPILHSSPYWCFTVKWFNFSVFSKWYAILISGRRETLAKCEHLVNSFQHVFTEDGGCNFRVILQNTFCFHVNEVEKRCKNVKFKCWITSTECLTDFDKLVVDWIFAMTRSQLQKGDSILLPILILLISAI